MSKLPEISRTCHHNFPASSIRTSSQTEKECYAEPSEPMVSYSPSRHLLVSASTVVKFKAEDSSVKYVTSRHSDKIRMVYSNHINRLHFPRGCNLLENQNQTFAPYTIRPSSQAVGLRQTGCRFKEIETF